MNLPTKENPKVKYVKKASQWVTTYFEKDSKNIKQIQVWSEEKPQ